MVGIVEIDRGLIDVLGLVGVLRGYLASVEAKDKGVLLAVSAQVDAIHGRLRALAEMSGAAVTGSDGSGRIFQLPT